MLVLDAIVDYLESKGFSDVYINYANEETNPNQEGKKRIVLIANAGSEQAIMESTQIFRFTIYVRSANRAEAEEIVNDVYNTLQNQFFKSGDLTIHQIVGKPPYFFGMIPQKINMSEFAINMRAMITNPSVNLTFDS